MAFATIAFGVTGLAYLGTWGGTAGPLEYLRGQRPPSVELPPPTPSITSEPRVVTVTVDGSRVHRRVSRRYLSFALDTSQLVGGDWWDPEARIKERGTGSVPAVQVDFDRERLDALVRPLTPAYLRLGGSEADKTFYDLDGRLDEPPPNHASILTADRWADLMRFVSRHDLELVFTLNAGPSARDSSGAWKPDNAEHLLRHVARRGDEVAVFELGNEANLFWYLFGPTHATSSRQYAEDLALARSLIERHSPNSRLTGQSSAFWPVIGEPVSVFFALQKDYLREAAPYLDHVAWHYYPQQSRRCYAASRRAHPARLLEPRNLDEVARYADWNAAWRDRYAPGLNLWMGETGNAQCGGEPGVSDRFIASLWWLDQLGLLALHHHWVVVRQTLTGSDYGLLSEPDLETRPDYWASLLWTSLMGTGVLQAQSSDPRVRAYVHCERGREGRSGSAILLAINLWPDQAVELEHAQITKGWVATAPDVLGTDVRLSGRLVKTTTTSTGGTRVPQLRAWGQRVTRPVLPPTSYGFFRLEGAAPACAVGASE